METKNGKRINNLPLNNLDDDIFFYLSIKVQLAKHLYFLVNFEINKKFDIDHLHLGISYIKIYCLIIQYYLQKNDRITIYCLLNLFNLKDYFTYWIQTLSWLYYFLNEAKIDLKYLENNTNKLYKKLILVNPYLRIIDSKFKFLFFQTMEQILTSKCIKQLINKFQYYDRNKMNVISVDDCYINFLKDIKDNIIFFPFFSKKHFGLTNSLNGKIVINDEYRMEGDFSICINNLFNFCIWVVTGINEILKYFLKDYYFYITGFVISEESPKNKETSSNDKKERTELFYEILYKNAQMLYISDILYILNLNNWDQNLDDFSKYFVSDERKNIVKNEWIKSIKIFDLNKQTIKILSHFDIELIDLWMCNTDTMIECKRTNSQPHIDLSRRRCLTHSNGLKVLKRLKKIK